MNKYERNSFYKYMDEIIPDMDKDDLKKLEFAKSFILNYIDINDAEDDPLVVIAPIRYKALVYVIFSMILDCEDMLGNPDSNSSKLSEPGDLTDKESKTIPKMDKRDKYLSLEVKDIFLVDELTPNDVTFIEAFLEKTNVKLEYGNKFFVVSTGQIVILLQKIMQEYRIFLSNGRSPEEKGEELPPEKV